MCPRHGGSEAIVRLFNTFARQPSPGEEIASSSVWNSRLVRIVREVWDTERNRVSLWHGCALERVVPERSAHHPDEGQERLV